VFSRQTGQGTSVAVGRVLRSCAIRAMRPNKYSMEKVLLRPFSGLFSGTTWVSRYQRGKTGLDLNEARDGGVWGQQWHQLDHMQTTCTAPRCSQITTPTPHHSISTGPMLFLMARQQRQSTEGGQYGVEKLGGFCEKRSTHV